MTTAELIVDGYRVESLGTATWDACAGLAERHNGVWGGCWCTYFHLFIDRRHRRQGWQRSPSRALWR